MKRHLMTILFLAGLVFPAVSQVCTLDTITDPGIYPDTLVNLPKCYINASYGTVIQVRVFTDTMSAAGNVTVTDIQINSVTGLPAGFTYACNPVNCTFPGGGNGCIYLSGTAGAGQTGIYNLVVNVTLHGKLFNVIPVSQPSQILGYKIEVLAAPVANFSATPLAVCKGETVSFSDLSTNSPVSWSWSFPGGTPAASSLQNPTVTYNTSGTYNATLTATNPAGNHTKIRTSYITVSSPPSASISVTGSLSLCQGSTVLLTANTGSGFTYQWIRNGLDIPGANSVSYMTGTSGTYKVRVTKPNGCYKISATKTVTVSYVNATASANGSTTFCAGQDVLLSANTGTGLTWQWRKNGVDISGATGSTYSAGSSGTYKVIVTNSNGCSKISNSISVVSNTLPTASFTANGPLTFCTGGSVLFSAAPGNNYTYQWKKNGNNISGANAINYSATKAGTYKVVVTNTTSGCSKASATKTVVINCKENVYGEFPSSISEITLYPNPANELVNLAFKLSENDRTLIGIYNMQGQCVLENTEYALKAGSHTIPLSTTGISAGLYVVRISNSDRHQILKLHIVNQ